MRAAGAGRRARRRHPAPVSPSLSSLGARIRAARQEAGLSQSQLGAPHFTRAFVSALELGKIRPSMKSLQFIAERLGKRVSYFLNEEAAEKRQREREFAMLRAKDLIARGQTNEAAAILGQLLEAESAPLESARIRRLLGVAYLLARDARAAIEHLARSLETLERIGTEREVQRAQRDLASALVEAGLADRALAIYRKLLEGIESRSPRDPVFRMAVLRGLGATYSMLGDSASAIAYYEQALDVAQDVGDLASLGRIYSGLAYGHWLGGDHEAAMSNMQRAVAIHRDARDLGSLAELHNNLAAMCLEQRHLTRAKEHVDQGRRIASLIGRPALDVHLSNTQAEISLEEGQLEDATKLCEEARDRAQSVGYQRGEATAHRLLGRIAARQGRRPEAEASFSRAAGLFDEVQMKSIAAECLYELSKWLTEWGQVAEAGAYASRAYELSRSKSYL